MRGILDQLPDDLRSRALTHPAFAPARADSYERLEFLGDAVLDLVITAAIFERHPDLAEGELSRVRAGVVSRDACAAVAQESELGEAMVAHAAGRGSAAEATARALAGQRNAQAALVESVIGAGFLVGGYEAVAPKVLAAFEGRIEHALANRIDAKSQLQELASRDGGAVAYGELGEDGPPHDRRFRMEARIDGGSSATKSLRAEGVGRSKQEAQQVAAAALLAQMERE
ncbi:MAG: ribonuclease [Thermoleophilia bacterium]|nr:ribonuclease [Thermoleophilia bacterium]MCZ4495684.1 ribonuclease [Thermoleophilia bacterium]